VTVHRKRAALKVMRRELAEVVAERRAFVRECHLLARIKHAHIVPLYGVSTTLSGLPCVLLRWCDNTVIRSLRLDEVGHDPEVRATVKREWPSRERLRLMAELADALDHLHTRAILGAHVAHRDVKPPNFGLTATRSLVLYDFGLSVALLAKHSTRGDTFELTGDTGTRRYMSPEVAEGKPYGVSVDVYGWAICAYEIFHLRGKPFHGLSVSQHTERVVRNGARPVIPSTWDHRLIELFPQAWATADRRCDAAKCRDVCRDIVAHPGAVSASFVSRRWRL
jgi:serine/threonine protein kinase